MKVNLLAENLQKKLTFVNHAISSRNDLPILLNVLLVASGDTLTLSSTDLEIGIQASLPATVEEEGSVTVPAKTFIELINSLPNERISLILEDNTLKVASKKTKSSFQTIPSTEFPKLYEEKGDLLASVKLTELRKDVSLVVFSASTDTVRPALSGILMKSEGEGFLFVGTDGYRLSLKHHAGTPGAVSTDQELLIPARVFREVLSLKDVDEDISLYVAKNSNQVIFEQKDFILVGRLIQGDFPKYEKIIPTDHGSQLSFDREELLKAVKICSIFARESANIVKLTLQKEKIIVSSQTQSLGDNTVDVEAVLIGEENEIAFNAKYLLDALSHIEKDVLVFEMTGPLNPGVFKIKDDATFLHLIMPIRVQA